MTARRNSIPRVIARQLSPGGWALVIGVAVIVVAIRTAFALFT